jgi:transcriptional regulator with XRE-family HTH domain
MNLNKQIRRLMDERGIDPLALAARMRGLGAEASYAAAHSWYSGRRTPRADALPAIARALGVEIADLYGDEDEGAADYCVVRPCAAGAA